LAQTTRHGSHHEDNLYPSDFFPFNTVQQHDLVTGERGDGLARSRKSGFLPKVFFTGSSTEYWTRSASLIHTDVEGKKDAEIDPNVRMYFVAGLSHGDRRYGPVGRALLTALDEWVSHRIEPPPSQLPRIADGTLVSLDTYRRAFPKIPGVRAPESFFMPLRLDPGPRWHSEGDPRLSILERYPTRQDYLAKVAECLLDLKRRRFLLDEDVANLLEQAAALEHWDQ